MKKSIYLLLCALLTTACASFEPTHIALNPTLGPVNLHTQLDVPIGVEVVDTRSKNYVVQFDQAPKQPRLVSTSEPIRVQLDSIFRRGMGKAGYVIDPAAPKRVQFQLEYLLTDVIDNTLNYEAKTRLVIKVKASNSTQEFTKTFSGNGYLKGPLSPDFATLELDINKLIDKLTTEILNDNELHQFLEK
ncbi:YajG family lipoprotein [Shewanella gaetbuli]|uniref:YajG family lipoprotein n=1 Tax=Shewanella gaetbuli TaxID=220752 RepID=A0A9X2CGY4_9GAMM|nr:YajG family lipoprotein [Shewanella gaetbuli]MCL1141392.1 YajG family lipoprotein [Shewanella gaetbuli]